MRNAQIIAFVWMQYGCLNFKMRIVSKITISAIRITYGTIRKIGFYYGTSRVILALLRGTGLSSGIIETRERSLCCVASGGAGNTV